MSYGHWGDYVPVAARRAQADRELARLRKDGQKISPVKIEGRAIANTFWGKAWCDNLEAYQDDANRLPRGRTYVRNGSVVDLQIAPSSVTARVMGSSMYKVSVTISPLPVARWNALCADCAGDIDSLIELLQGRFSESVMERLCRPASGLFPKPSDIGFSCSCPDYSDMCKHVAAALYGVGARLDKRPELLFRLRAVDEKALVGGCKSSSPLFRPGATKSNVLEATNLSALFGLDISQPEASPAPGEKASANARTKARSAKSNDPPAAVLAKPGLPVLKMPTDRFADEASPTFRRKTRLHRQSKQSQTGGEAVRSLPVNEASARSNTKTVAAKATTKPK